MNQPRWILSLLVLLLAALGCGLTDTIGGTVDDLRSVTELWDDVPRMDGLTRSDKDLPLPIKLVVRTVVAQLLSGGTGSGDWIVFTTDKTGEDVKAFYTNDVMAEHGWEASDTSTCLDGSDQGVSQVGALCVFQKQVGSTYTGLMVLSMDAETAGQTNVIFVRIEGEQTPEPGATANAP